MAQTPEKPARFGRNREALGGEWLKRVVGEFAIDRVVDHLARDPENALPKLLDFADRVAQSPGHHAGIAGLRQRLSGDPQVAAQARRILTNPHVVKRILNTWVLNAILLGNPKRQQRMKELNLHIPTAILIDPTSACNLRCTGCWAGSYRQADRLEPELLDRILDEAEDLGIYWIVLSGGEPFAYKELLDVVERHPNLAFMAYTNGTLIDDRVADRLAELGNFSPAISLEGWEEQTDARRGPGVFAKVMAAMDRLLQRGVLFGASVTVTRHNVDLLYSDEFIDFLINKGALYVWSFHYIPIGRGPDTDLMLLPEQRAWLVRRVNDLRHTKPLLIADFWNDGHVVGGCIAGGRTYFHINAAGDIEPCAFVHFATDNIRNLSLAQALRNPVFAAYQKRQPFAANHYAPCPIIDNPQSLRDIVAESGARPTHVGAEDVLTGATAAFLDQRSAEWHRVADQLEEERRQAAAEKIPVGAAAGRK